MEAATFWNQQNTTIRNDIKDFDDNTLSLYLSLSLLSPYLPSCLSLSVSLSLSLSSFVCELASLHVCVRACVHTHVCVCVCVVVYV